MPHCKAATSVKAPRGAFRCDHAAVLTKALDTMLGDLSRALAGQGVAVSIAGLWHSLGRWRIAIKERTARPVRKGKLETDGWSASTYPLSESCSGQDGFHVLQAS
jgi:hypothetical protein